MCLISTIIIKKDLPQNLNTKILFLIKLFTDNNIIAEGEHGKSERLFINIKNV